MDGYGVPCHHVNNDYDQWCQEIGYSGFGSVLTDTVFVRGALKWCSGYDDTEFKWCDWKGGYWKNKKLNKTEPKEYERIERLRCSKGNDTAYEIFVCFLEYKKDCFSVF